LPWFGDALEALPEDQAMFVAWGSVVVRLGWVFLDLSLHPRIPSILRMMPRGKRWLAISVACLTLLIFAQAVVVVLLTLLWIDALQAVLPFSRRREHFWLGRFLDVKVRGFYDDRAVDIRPEQVYDPDE
jgi:hypothetical protein